MSGDETYDGYDDGQEDDAEDADVYFRVMRIEYGGDASNLQKPDKASSTEKVELSDTGSMGEPSPAIDRIDLPETPTITEPVESDNPNWLPLFTHQENEAFDCAMVEVNYLAMRGWPLPRVGTERTANAT